MGIKVIKSEIPQPLANYSEASQAGDLIFAAGQLASDWKDGVPKEARKHPNFPFYGSDIKLQADFILKNLAKTFKAAGTSLDNVVKAQVFLMVTLSIAMLYPICPETMAWSWYSFRASSMGIRSMWPMLSFLSDGRIDFCIPKIRL